MDKLIRKGLNNVAKALWAFMFSIITGIFLWALEYNDAMIESRILISLLFAMCLGYMFIEIIGFIICMEKYNDKKDCFKRFAKEILKKNIKNNNMIYIKRG